MSLAEQARRARNFTSEGFLPFAVEGERLGWMRPEFVEYLRRWPAVFEMQDGRVALSRALDTVRARSSALARCNEILRQEGVLTGWRNETYAIDSARDAAPLFHIERAGMRSYGLTGAVAHLNGYVVEGNTTRIWTARRSLSKSIDPGLLDNLVGGGIASGYSAWETLLKECHEEAGLPAALVETTRGAGCLRSQRRVPEGLHSETIHVYDLALPADFTPANQDGEVSELCLLDVPELLTRIERGELCADSSLVALDFLLRHELLARDNPETRSLTQIVNSCRCSGSCGEKD